jgi:hypothetical protein
MIDLLHCCQQENVPLSASDAILSLGFKLPYPALQHPQHCETNREMLLEGIPMVATASRSAPAQGTSQAATTMKYQRLIQGHFLLEGFSHWRFNIAKSCQDLL